MSSAHLPHLVIFTADQDIPSSTPSNSRRESTTNEERNYRSRPSLSLVGKVSPRSVALHLLTEIDDLSVLLMNTPPAMLVIEHEGGQDQARETVKEILKRIRGAGTQSAKRTFVVLWSVRASKDARERSYCKGINMITDQIPNILNVLSTIQVHYAASMQQKFGFNGSPTIAGTPDTSASARLFPCPFCGITLPLHHLHTHVPLFHIQEPNGTVCSICKDTVANLPKHLTESHSSMGSRMGLSPTEAASLRRGSSESSSQLVGRKQRQPVFVLAVIRRPRDGKFLMVDEVASQGWWLPGGGVDVGEDIVRAAERECMEETGIEVEITGVLRVEYTPSSHGFRLRIILYGEPKDPTQKPKAIPDIESAAACWVSADHIGEHIPLRGREPATWFPYLTRGGAIWPLTLLAHEKDDCVYMKDPFGRDGKPKQGLADTASLKESIMEIDGGRRLSAASNDVPDF
ncbi:hypothetical protein HDV05_003429 [Chytridiales sp. JEL 0842]|nr:hypothetical protein HDV05_003429 [Chytridiales sp. JEL 0842]